MLAVYRKQFSLSHLCPGKDYWANFWIFHPLAVHFRTARHKCDKLYIMFVVARFIWRINPMLDWFVKIMHICLFRIIIHPGYNGRTIQNDIALLELSSDIQFTSAIFPICLPKTAPTASSTCYATGWGLLNGKELWLFSSFFFLFFPLILSSLWSLK